MALALLDPTIVPLLVPPHVDRCAECGKDLALEHKATCRDCGSHLCLDCDSELAWARFALTEATRCGWCSPIPPEAA